MTPDPLSTAVPENPAGDSWTAQDVGLQAMGLLETRYAPLDEATHSEPGNDAPDLGPGYMRGGTVSQSLAMAAATADTLDPQSWNAYAYARNTACTSADASGLVSLNCVLTDTAQGAVLGALVGGAVGYVGGLIGGPAAVASGWLGMADGAVQGAIGGTIWGLLTCSQ